MPRLAPETGKTPNVLETRRNRRPRVAHRLSVFVGAIDSIAPTDSDDGALKESRLRKNYIAGHGNQLMFMHYTWVSGDTFHRICSSAFSTTRLGSIRCIFTNSEGDIRFANFVAIC